MKPPRIFAICKCSLKFPLCAVGDARLCYKWSCYPDTPDGRQMAALTDGRVYEKPKLTIVRNDKAA